MDVTLVYRGTDGQASTERKQEGLISDGAGGYLLDTDDPAGVTCCLLSFRVWPGCLAHSPPTCRRAR